MVNLQFEVVSSVTVEAIRESTRSDLAAGGTNTTIVILLWYLILGASFPIH